MMLTDPDGYLKALAVTAAFVVTKLGLDRARGNSHVTKSEFRSLDKKVDGIQKSVSTIEGWIRGRIGEPPT